MQKSYYVLLGILIALCIQSCVPSESDSKSEDTKEENKQPSMERENLDWIVDELVIKWKNNKDYCIETIEAMPESEFDFAPADSMHTFAEQAAHIVSTMHWQMEKLGFTKIPEYQEGSKAQIVASFNELFDYLISEIESMDSDELKATVGVFYGESSKRRLFNLLDNHVAHHRGQMIVYLRLKSITPPKFRGW